MMVKAVIFDFYGVLAFNGWQAFKVKHFSEREEIWNQVFELGKKVDAGLVDYEELVQFTAQSTGETPEAVRYQMEHTVANDPLFAYMDKTLRGHYKLGILSNASSNVVDTVLSPEQEAFFDKIILSHHVGFIKPDIRMYRAIAEHLGVEMHECVFIDDQERHTSGAKAAGMQAIIYEDLPQLEMALGKILSN